MKKALLVVLPIFLTGCSGFGTFLNDTVSPPWASPTAPQGQSENLSKVMGGSVSEPPLLPEGGDIWPGAPDPMPSLRDVSRSSHSIAETLDDPNSYFGRMATGRKESGDIFGEGRSVSLGETEATKNGVKRESRKGASTPSSDPSQKYLEKDGATVEIPNGDGTVTLISPQGNVSVRKVRKQ